MPAWPGGPCPECGEDMPEKIIHCRSCRALLNPDLKPDSVEVPEFIPMQEIAAMVEVELVGYYVACPHCNQELRIARKYVGRTVQCKFCEGRFPLDFSRLEVSMAAFYTACPHCDEELRAREKYLGQKVACKHCGGKIHVLAEHPS